MGPTMVHRARARPRSRAGRDAQHGLIRSAALHLAPGALVVAQFFLVGLPLAGALGLPPSFAFALNVPLVLVPFELGLLLVLGRRRNGRLLLRGIVLFRERLPRDRLALLVLALFAFGATVALLLAPLDDLLRRALFAWMPDALTRDALMPDSLAPDAGAGRLTARTLVAVQAGRLLLLGMVAPVVEELYFRGYLLPRLARLGGWAPLVHTVLFTLYHFWSPWRFVTRMMLTLPIVYAVWRTRSIEVGIWTHVLGNVAAELLALAAILRAAGV